MELDAIKPDELLQRIMDAIEHHCDRNTGQRRNDLPQDGCGCIQKNVFRMEVSGMREEVEVSEEN